jgi:hypothetical protein
VDINLKLVTGKKGSTREVAHEYGIDPYILQKHRGHKSFHDTLRPPPSEETLRRIEEADTFIQAHLQQLDESGELLRKYLERKEVRASSESRSS